MTTPQYLFAPLKAVAREMVVDVSRRLSVYGSLADSTYVGLGALEFVDFELVYERLGTRRMISIEGNFPLERLEFNRPYDAINVLVGRTNRRLPEIPELKTQRCIVWLDYTQWLNGEARSDLAYLAGVLQPGSAIFVTLNANASERDLIKLQDAFGDYFDGSRRLAEYLGASLADRQFEVASTVLERHLSNREDSISSTAVLDVRYSDSSPMQVLGWVVSAAEQDPEEECGFKDLVFTLPARGGEPLTLAWPSITVREWKALMQQMPKDAADVVPPHRWIDAEAIKRFVGVHRYGRPRAAHDWSS